MKRKSSLRLQGYDYGSPGAYFITLCIKDRRHLFGEIIDKTMKLSELGNMMEAAWKETAEIRKEIRLDEFCIMPDHFHGIFWITENGQLPSLNHVTLPQTPGYKNAFGPQYRNVSTTVNKLKGAVTRRARQAGYHDFGWLRNLNDRVIRDVDEYERIVAYIKENPDRWQP